MNGDLLLSNILHKCYLSSMPLGKTSGQGGNSITLSSTLCFNKATLMVLKIEKWRIFLFFLSKSMLCIQNISVQNYSLPPCLTGVCIWWPFRPLPSQQSIILGFLWEAEGHRSPVWSLKETETHPARLLIYKRPCNKAATTIILHTLCANLKSKWKPSAWPGGYVHIGYVLLWG